MLQVEGVGLGAIAAAAKMGEVDPLTMATWAPGEPVPFSFLADTFEVRRRIQYSVFDLQHSARLEQH